MFFICAKNIQRGGRKNKGPGTRTCPQNHIFGPPPQQVIAPSHRGQGTFLERYPVLRPRNAR